LMKSYLFELKQKQQDVENLTVKAGFDGLVLQSLLNADTGRYIRKGQPIAFIADAKWQVQAVISEHEFAEKRYELSNLVFCVFRNHRCEILQKTLPCYE